MRPIGPKVARAGASLALAWLLAAGLAPPALADEAAAPAPIEAGPPGLTILFPEQGVVVTTPDIPIRVAASNFHVNCDESGLHERAGAGHIHAMLNGMTMAQLTNLYCTQSFWISGQGLRPGQQTLIVDLATNDHMDLPETAQTVTFLYQPSTPAAEVPAPWTARGQAITILEPADGATVGPTFDLKARATNFIASCDLEGKPNVAGFGHYHVFVDMDLSMPMDMSMMNMPGMISMPCRDTIPVDLSAWPSGQHLLAIELEQNDHTPLMEPGQMAPKFAAITINLQNPFRP